MKIGLGLVVVWALSLAWAERTLNRRAYRVLWAVAVGTVFAAGLVL